MAFCIPYRDYPLRGRISSGGVVHAVRKGRPWARKGEEDELVMACRYYSNMEAEIELTPNDTVITCKNCLRELGDRKEAQERFAVKTKDGLFLSGRGPTGQIADAKLFKLKHAAVRWVSSQVYFSEDGREITWQEARDSKMSYKLREKLAKRRLNKGSKVVRVVILEDEEVDLSDLAWLTK